jgi:hypothetical protein
MIEAVLSKLNAIPGDKVMHYASGVLLFALCLIVMRPRYAMAVVMLTAVAKEVYDAFNRDKHTPDIFDALATVAGGGTAYFCTL